MFVIVLPDGSSIPVEGLRIVQIPTLRDDETVKTFTENPSFMDTFSSRLSVTYQATYPGEIVKDTYDEKFYRDVIESLTEE
jgi:hypothetical protein